LSLVEAIEDLVAHDEILVGLDFDGTLAPIVEHPDLAEPDPEALRLVREIARVPGFQVAIVSGRSLSDLRSRVGAIESATFVGEHGNDVEGVEVEPSQVLEEAGELVDSLLERFPEAVVEKKRRSVTFHTRRLDREKGREAAAVIRNWVADKPDVTLLEGKEVFELTTATGDKGDAIRLLARGRPVIYIGDDTTDEAVFEKLGPDDIGVKVGEGQTRASHRTEDITGVVTILSQIALASSR
jgi:trehalose-phosphatase